MAFFLTGCGYDLPHPFSAALYQEDAAPQSAAAGAGPIAAQCRAQAAQRTNDAMTRANDFDDTFRQKVYAAAYSECVTWTGGNHR
jgi:hypothetical protein